MSNPHQMFDGFEVLRVSATRWLIINEWAVRPVGFNSTCVISSRNETGGSAFLSVGSLQNGFSRILCS